MKGAGNVAVLLFDNVEPLDFCGPFEVFAATQLKKKTCPFHVYTCAERTDPVWARGRLSLNPIYPLHNCPAPDILIIPGGFGTRELINNARVMSWLTETVPRCEIVLSICTGALVLAKGGWLEGLEATTHRGALDLLRQLAPRTKVTASKRFVDNGKFVVAAGIAAGIDAALHVVARKLGQATALATAEYMEYPWRPAP